MIVATDTRPFPKITRDQFQAAGLKSGPSLDTAVTSAIRRNALLEGCKWDPQVGDQNTLAGFPLIIKRAVWEQLASWAEQLAIESVAAEHEILTRPELLRHLGLPRSLQKVLAASIPFTPAAGRIIRFDFHFTTDGWRISEANTDVPGGLTEASQFTAQMAAHFPDLVPAGNPGDDWCDALAAAAGPCGVIALLSASGYMEDHQVNAFLATQLEKRGHVAHLAKPEQLKWNHGRAYLETAWCEGPVDAIVRFYQAEWLSRLPAKTCWARLLRGGTTPVANPAHAIISESKRFPLVWSFLSTELPTWHALLPQTRDPRHVNWSSGDSWLLKSALCNTGDTVTVREMVSAKRWRQVSLSTLLSPGSWVAQRRFQTVPIATPLGPRHVCIGVYTINGHTTGAYARLSEKPVIDYSATDVALLVQDND